MRRPVASTQPFPLAGELAALASSLLWAGAGIVFRSFRGRVPAMAINLGKNAVATVLLGVTVVALTGAKPLSDLSPAALSLLALSGVVGLTACDSFLLRAMMEIGPRRATLIGVVAPCLVFVGALLPPFSQLERVASFRPWAGFALAIAGVVLAATGGAPLGPEAHDPERERRGVRDALFAAFLQAGGFLLARRAFELGAEPVSGAFVRLLSGSIGLLIVGAATRALPEWKRSFAAPGVLRTLAITAFFSTYLGIGLNQLSIAWSRSTGVAAVLNSLAPVWLIPMSAFFLGERITRRGLVATAVALGGVALLSL
jgi:drug/metabolite transporter (DMT)-like permease